MRSDPTPSAMRNTDVATLDRSDPVKLIQQSSPMERLAIVLAIAASLLPLVPYAMNG